MLERGVIPQAYGRDDAWTLTLFHGRREIDKIIDAFTELAPQIAGIQEEGT
jgi:hypothetical protein